jgi:hypothetical protein
MLRASLKIARLAGHPEVLFGVEATLREGNDVIKVQ